MLKSPFVKQEEIPRKRTPIDLFRQSVQRYPDNPRIGEKKEGGYRFTPYRACFEQVSETAPDLIHFGHRKWLPSTFALLGKSFIEANQFLNSTLRMIRWRITQHDQDRIHTMHTPEGKDPFHPQNRIIIQRMVE